MKAFYLSEHGGIDKLTYGELPDPIALRNEVLARGRACGVHHADLWFRRDMAFFRLQFPFAPGLDVVGEVVGLGPAISPVGVGARSLLCLAS